MPTTYTYTSSLSAVWGARAAVRGWGIEGSSTPRRGLESTIYALTGRDATRHVTVHDEGLYRA